MSQNQFQRIALIAKPDDDEKLMPTLRRLHAFLSAREIQAYCDLRAAELLGRTDGLSLVELAQRSQLAIVVGGDGTLLSSARQLVDANVPLLGVNLGRLGFLTDISPDDMLNILQAILQGDYQQDERFLLSCQIGDQAAQLALNDVVLHKWNIARMIEFETRVNGSFVDTQRSDGVIISTPTGSTAYALSVGGPLMSPDLDAILLAPICPHTLSNRPMAVRGDSEIVISVRGKTDPQHVRVTCDGQVSSCLMPGDKIRIWKYPSPVCLLHPAGQDHFDILRAKLGWGGKTYSSC